MGILEDNRAVRISITLPKKVLEELEQSMQEIGIKKRSAVIRKAVEAFALENRALSKKGKEECVGTISYTYEHDRKELMDSLLDVQHDFGKVIVSTLHIHLDSERCFETLIIRGKTSKVRILINHLRRLELTNLNYQVV